jgi:hypothetical protein
MTPGSRVAVSAGQRDAFHEVGAGDDVAGELMRLMRAIAA